MEVINLLPPDMKNELQAARTNTMLLKYLITSFAGFGAILVIFGTSFYINYMNYETYKAQLATSEQKIASLKEVRQKTKEYNDNLARAKQIFSKEVRLSRLVADVSSKLPPGSVLSNVSLNLAQLTKPISVVAYVDSFEKASVLKRNFEESGLFKSVSLIDVSGREGSGSSEGSKRSAGSAYPFKVNLEATLVPAATSAGKPQAAEAGTGEKAL